MSLAPWSGVMAPALQDAEQGQYLDVLVITLEF
jgi:hypothetical protein